jgi:diguanylate cyclase (GGDEF)-like protein
VRLADGSLFGTLCATSRQQQPYNLEGEQVMGLFAKLISHYVEKDTLVQQLQAANVALELHSSTDELTQLPNRRALFKQLALRFASARAQQQQVALIFIDLDGFKAINDRFGHPCGDSFLVQVGERLTAVARREDIVGRLGGDEFLIVGSAQQPAAQQAYVTTLRQPCAGSTSSANSVSTMRAPASGWSSAIRRVSMLKRPYALPMRRCIRIRSLAGRRILFILTKVRDIQYHAGHHSWVQGHYHEIGYSFPGGDLYHRRRLSRLVFCRRLCGAGRGIMKKAPLLCWLSPSWRWPAPSSAGGDRRDDIAELSYPINKLTLYTHVIRRGILGHGEKNSGRSKDEKADRVTVDYRAVHAVIGMHC